MRIRTLTYVLIGLIAACSLQVAMSQEKRSCLLGPNTCHCMPQKELGKINQYAASNPGKKLKVIISFFPESTVTALRETFLNQAHLKNCGFTISSWDETRDADEHTKRETVLRAILTHDSNGRTSEKVFSSGTIDGKAFIQTFYDYEPNP